MNQEELRKKFEADFPPPDGVSWSQEKFTYVLSKRYSSVRDISAVDYKYIWLGYQAGAKSSVTTLASLIMKANSDFLSQFKESDEL